MTAWGTPHQWFRTEPDFAPLLVLAISLAIPLLLLRGRPRPIPLLLSLLVGFSWLAATRAIGPILPSLCVIALLAAVARIRTG